MELPHIRIVAATLAAFGIHLISPFFVTTAIVYKDDAIKHANNIRVKMAEVLAKQRGGYYGFGQKDKEYYVFDQAPNTGQTITNNLEQERQCGDADHRLKKKPSISTVSRGVILKSTVALRDANPNPSDFRKMGSVVKVLEQINNEWSTKQESLRIAGLSKKEALKLHVDQRKFAILSRLKQDGGPFSNAEEVKTFMKDHKEDKAQAQKRMRDEITYARDTSTSLPRQHHLFKDHVTKKRRVKNVDEFAESLKILLGNAWWMTFDEH